MEATQSTVARPPVNRPANTKAIRYSNAFFRYDGATGLTAVGAATGTRYRFESPGAVVAVDFRDQPSLQAVPHLRQVNSP